MTVPAANDIRAIVFDLDGTLYVSDEYAATIQDAAVGYVSGLLGLNSAEASQILADTRRRMADENDAATTTLSAACCELGGTTPALHDYFQRHMRPESYLKRDDRVVHLIERLGRHFSLYVFTNNNRPLTEHILLLLGLEGRFDAIYCIDETWESKPHEARLDQILKATGLSPHKVLFVGDRYEVDLQLPEQKGCPIYLSQSIEQLLRLEELIVRNNR